MFTAHHNCAVFLPAVTSHNKVDAVTERGYHSLSMFREMTINAHQKQSEELQESFQQKLLEAENCPKKVMKF